VKYTRDTAFGAAALVVLLVLYVRGVPQSVYAAVISGGSNPTDGLAGGGAGLASFGPFPSGGGGSKSPGIAPAPGPVTTPPVTNGGTIYPVSTLPGVDAWFRLYKDQRTSDGRSTWYDLIVPCAERTGSFDTCIPKG
jgi:hypothetical protein